MGNCNHKLSNVVPLVAYYSRDTASRLRCSGGEESRSGNSFSRSSKSTSSLRLFTVGVSNPEYLHQPLHRSAHNFYRPQIMEDSGRHSLVGTTNSGQPQPQQGVNTTTAPATGSPPGAPMQPLSVPETMARETGAPSQEISQPPPQAMSAFAPFLVQPMFPQHILQQQLNHTNTQAMIQNLLQSHNNHNSQSATVNSVLSTTNETSDQQHISTTQQSPTENQAPSMTAIQNLIRLTTPQGMTPNFQPWNASHFNMLQNLITMNSAQTQNDPSMTPIDDTPSAQTETLAASQIQQSQNAFHAIQPSAQIPNPAGNASISTGSQPAYAFPSFLKINTLPTTQTTGYWLAPPFPAVYGGMVLPPSQLITQPNPLMMQNLFTQITANPVPTALQPVTGSPAEVPSSASIPPNGTMAVTRDNLHETSRNKHGLPMLIYMDFDEETLTDYQCLLRKQIELFEAGPEDVKASAQGRNNPIYLGQIGIRCRFCATLPLKCRPRGAVYYSKTIVSIHLRRGRNDIPFVTKNHSKNVLPRTACIKWHKI